MIALSVTAPGLPEAGRTVSLLSTRLQLCGPHDVPVPVSLGKDHVGAVPLFRWPGPLAAGKYLLASGLALFYAGARHYDLRHFLGLKQVATGNCHSVLSASGHLQKDGILQLTRHPWYLAALLLIWTGDVTTVSAVGKMILTAYILVYAPGRT